MSSTNQHRSAGFSLLELLLASAIVLVVVGATAQGLVSYYSSLDLQNQRTVAVQDCAGVLSEIRDVRNNNPNDFPDAITTRWPGGAEVADVGALRNERVTVNYQDETANPLNVTVTARWEDMRGRPATVSVSTMLTDR